MRNIYVTQFNMPVSQRVNHLLHNIMKLTVIYAYELLLSDITDKLCCMANFHHVYILMHCMKHKIETKSHVALHLTF